MDLKPCPFCGANYEDLSGHTAESGIHFYHCYKCKAEGPGVIGDSSMAWNTRADIWHKWPDEKPPMTQDYYYAIDEDGGWHLAYYTLDGFWNIDNDLNVRYWRNRPDPPKEDA